MDRQCLSFLLLLGLLTPPTHLLPLGKAGRVDRGPLLPAGGFPGIPRPPGPAPSPSAPPPPPPPAGVALPLASSSGGGGESSGGRLRFAAAAGWIVSISLFSRSLALLRGTGGGVSLQPPSEKATHTQRAKAAASGLRSSSRSGAGEGARVRPGCLSRASAPLSRPGSSEGD